VLLHLPQTVVRGRAHDDVSRGLADAEYVGRMEAVVFRFRNGTIYGVNLRELEGADDTPVARVWVSSDGYAATIEQFSGNQLEVPWDVVLYHAEPRHEYRRPEA
jgi:sporulation protein YlmC with PRC-barrel domain